MSRRTTARRLPRSVSVMGRASCVLRPSPCWPRPPAPMSPSRGRNVISRPRCVHGNRATPLAPDPVNPIRPPLHPPQQRVVPAVRPRSSIDVQASERSASVDRSPDLGHGTRVHSTETRFRQVRRVEQQHLMTSGTDRGRRSRRSWDGAGRWVISGSSRLMTSPLQRKTSSSPFSKTSDPRWPGPSLSTRCPARSVIRADPRPRRGPQDQAPQAAPGCSRPSSR